MRAVLLLLSALALVTSTVSLVHMDTAYEWRYIDYIWGPGNTKEEAVAAGNYDYTQIVPMDVAKSQDGRVFVSLRGKAPAGLGIVTDRIRHSGPLIRPYPDWSYFKVGQCDSIQHVYRIAIDECQRLWVLDLGFIEGQENTCGPQMLAFDLKTDRLIKRLRIPREYAIGSNNQSLPVTPIIETSGSQCEDTTIYIADTDGFGLIIWNNGAWSRIENSRFRPSEDAVELISGTYKVEWNSGLAVMDLSPALYRGEKRSLYFRALSSYDVYAANTSDLKKCKSTDGNDIDYFAAKGVLRSQAISMAFSSQGTLFLGSTRESAITCWNRYKPFTPQNMDNVAQDDMNLQYISGMKVAKDPRSGEEELWVMSNRYVAFRLKRLNYNNYNYRILKSPVKKLIAGGVCELPENIKQELSGIPGNC